MSEGVVGIDLAGDERFANPTHEAHIKVFQVSENLHVYISFVTLYYSNWFSVYQCVKFGETNISIKDDHITVVNVFVMIIVCISMQTYSDCFDALNFPVSLSKLWSWDLHLHCVILISYGAVIMVSLTRKQRTSGSVGRFMLGKMVERQM